MSNYQINTPNVLIPYRDFKELNDKAAKTDAVLMLLGSKFPDDTCQLIAIKSVLGYVDPEPEPEPEPTPDPEPNPNPEPDDENNTEPEDPEEGGATTDPNPEEPESDPEP